MDDAQPTETTQTAEAQTTTTPAPTRPEWLPEKFDSPETFAKSYSELESKLGKGEEELRKTLMTELEQKAFENRPATAGDYQIPEVLDAETAGSDPLLKWWADYSWQNGLSQDEFDKGIQQFADYMKPEEVDLDTVNKELGDNANQRVEAVQLWMNKFFPDKAMQEAVAELGSSSAGIKALEHIIEQTKGTNLNVETVATGQVTQADIEAKMKDPRYWQQGRRDDAYVNEVNNDWKRLLDNR